MKYQPTGLFDEFMIYYNKRGREVTEFVLNKFTERRA